MAIGAKHVLVVALVTLLLTYAAYRGKFPSDGDAGVSVAGRKGLSDAQFSEKAPMVAEDSVTESEATEPTPALAQDSETETESETSEDTTVETIEGDASSPTTVESEETSEQISEEAIEDSKEEVSEVEVEVSEEPAVEESEEATPVEESEDATPVEESEDATPVEESWNSDVRTEENVDFFTETSEEAFEGEQVRELEATSPASGSTTAMENLDSSNYPMPKDNPGVFLQEIARDNAVAKQNEGLIQSCIKEDGCGTPDP